MHRTHLRALGATTMTLALAAGMAHAQQMEQTRAIENGGIHVEGWTGKIDAREAEAGMKLENARLAMEGDALKVTTGPAVTYWNPANRATGTYSVKATFTEPAFMNRNNHPHPYGIVIAGSDLGTDQQSYLYCSAYGNGSFIVRGFGPEAFALNGRRAQAHDAVHKAPAQGQPVTQEIAINVKADVVECAINGTVVASYPKSELVTAGRLKSTDGLFGIRFGHNTEALVRGLAVTPGN